MGYASRWKSERHQQSDPFPGGWRRSAGSTSAPGGNRVADINQPRIPSVTQILKAGRKPQEIWELADLGIEPGAAVEPVSNLAPELQRQRVVVKSNEEFTQVLQAEGFTGR